MKTHSIFKSAYLLFLFLFILVSCGNQDTDNIGPKFLTGNQDYRKISIQGEGKSHFTELNINVLSAKNPVQSRIRAVAESNIDHLQKVQCELSHITQRDQYNNVLLKNGKFEFISNNGNFLYGTYSSSRPVIDVSNPVDLKMKISGGSGELLDAKGNISLVLTPDKHSKEQFKLTFRGVILLPEKQQQRD